MGVEKQRVAVVGAGIAGLTAAYQLQKAGCEVTVLEVEASVGGRMSCRRVDGFTFNRAATLLAGRYDFLIGLVKELGLEHKLSYGHSKLGTLRNGKVYNLRTNHVLLDSLFSGLLSWKSKLLMPRLLLDVARLRPVLRFDDLSVAAPHDFETAEGYALRRLNREINDYVVDPAMAALLVVPSSRPSSIDLMFTVAHYLGMGAYSIDGGIDFLVNELARRVPVTTNARVEKLTESADGVEVSWTSDGSVHREQFDASIVALSAHAVPKIFPQLKPEQAKILDAFEYSTIMVGHFGLSSPPDLESDFIQIPIRENQEIANLLLAHKQGRNMVPPGKGLVVAYGRHEWGEARLDWSDDRILDEMIQSIEKIIPGVSKKVEVRNLERWKPALFMSKVGSYKAMASLKASWDPASRVKFAGDYFSFTSTNASAMSGDDAAQQVLQRLIVRRSM